MQRTSIVAVVILIGLALPASGAWAQGNSAIDQYTENIPGASGDVNSGSGDASGGAPGAPDRLAVVWRA